MLWLEAKAWYELDERDKAEAALQHARSIAEPMSARPMLIQILSTLADVAQARGESESAEQLRQQARTHADFIAAHSPEEFRASFYASQFVRPLFDSATDGASDGVNNVQRATFNALD